MGNNNGKIFAPVRVKEDIAYVLGRSTGAVGLLCADVDEMGVHVNAIKKYAKYKPIEHPQPIELTDAMRGGVNYGVDCSDTATGCFSSNLGELLTRAKAVNDWNMIPPSTWYRVLDFDGYYNAPRPPFAQIPDIVGNVTSPTSQEQIWQRLPVVAQKDIVDNVRRNLQPCDLVEALTRKGDIPDDFRFGYLYRNASTPTAVPTLASVGSAGDQSIDNFDGYAQPVSFTPPSSYASPVTYDVVFIAYVLKNGTYWATFFPKTYCQMKLSLLSVLDENDVSIEGQTLNFPKTGGSRQLKISGYNWGSNWGGKGNPDAPILMTLSPDHGGTISNWAEVELNVGNANIATFEGYYTTTVRIDAPGVVTDSPNYYIDFRVRQQCNQKVHEIDHTDSEGNSIGNLLQLSTNRIEAEKAFYITSDIAWERGSIVWIDSEGDEHDASSEISVGPASSAAPYPGVPYKVTTCTVVNLIELPAGRHYQVVFRNNTYGALYRLNIYSVE